MTFPIAYRLLQKLAFWAMVAGAVSCGRIAFEELDSSGFIDWSDSDSSEGEGGTDSVNNLFYSGPVEAVPIFAADGERTIQSDSNSLGIQGNWYAYNDGISTTNMSNSVGGFFYISGEVVAGAPEQYRYIGMGMGLCVDQVSTFFPIDSCPWAAELSNRIVGIAFDVNGTYPVTGELTLLFIDSATGSSLMFPISATGHYEVLFSQMRIRQSNTPFAAGNIDRVQFQLGNQTSAAINYDFFVGNMEMLVRPL